MARTCGQDNYISNRDINLGSLVIGVNAATANENGRFALEDT